MELETAQALEGMPSTLAGFKDHPLYVLTRHLKQTEIIHPPPPETAEVGKFRGEPVYPRSSVVTLKTPENWLRSEGRSVREGEQPLKWIKYRAGTVNRMRELEVLRDELRVAGEAEPANGGEADAEIMQGLYTYSQTEAYVPPPVVNVSPFFSKEQTFDAVCRESSRRITSGTLTSTYHLCYLRGRSIYHVQPSSTPLQRH